MPYNGDKYGACGNGACGMYTVRVFFILNNNTNGDSNNSRNNNDDDDNNNNNIINFPLGI